MSKRIPQEEKVAKILVYAVNDLTLDLEQVGEYVAEIANTVLYNRLQVVFETAEFEKAHSGSRDRHYARLNELSLD